MLTQDTERVLAGLGQMDMWAKTTPLGEPGLSIRSHGIIVGSIAGALLGRLNNRVRVLFPPASATLVSLHDIGKIAIGFLIKCPIWVIRHGLSEAQVACGWGLVESDHAKIGQLILQSHLNDRSLSNWAIAIGSHHGGVISSWLKKHQSLEYQSASIDRLRTELIADMIAIFGPLPTQPPSTDLTDLWLLAGLMTVSDWIGSNEDFFPVDQNVQPKEATARAHTVLAQIGMTPSSMKPRTFGDAFCKPDTQPFQPNTLQSQLHELAANPGLFIVEGPMGCGKTEAALYAALRLIQNDQQSGMYFALPTQVTSNRIYERVEGFLQNVVDSAAQYRLAHSASWLTDDANLVIRPSLGDSASKEHAIEGRTWFSSAKRALLSHYGVGTIDQALLSVIATKHFFVRRFGLAGKVVILDEVHSYDIYTGTILTHLVKQLLATKCTVIILSATLTQQRRAELVQAAGACIPSKPATCYPLITTVIEGRAVEHPIAWEQTKRVACTMGTFDQGAILAECLNRAGTGQHVLYIRNTVADAQEAFLALKGQMCEGEAEVGLLHSRFPYFRRQELEAFWLERLGKNRPSGEKGSILIATQVVEQSVDIDLDWIVTDLAPTDMLLQRMGRLWRHARSHRNASQPEFWINLPQLTDDMPPKEIKKALGRSGRVYSPYVLLMTMETIRGRTVIDLPGDIRDLLEATYREEPVDRWMAFWRELQARKTELVNCALTATQVLGRPSTLDEKASTRWSEIETVPLTLIKRVIPVGSAWRVKFENGEELQTSSFAWERAFARAAFRNSTRIPLWMAKGLDQPKWLQSHASGAFVLDQSQGGSVDYHADRGVSRSATDVKHNSTYDSDDEFDS